MIPLDLLAFDIKDAFQEEKVSYLLNYNLTKKKTHGNYFSSKQH